MLNALTARPSFSLQSDAALGEINSCCMAGDQLVRRLDQTSSSAVVEKLANGVRPWPTGPEEVSGSELRSIGFAPGRSTQRETVRYVTPAEAAAERMPAP